MGPFMKIKNFTIVLILFTVTRISAQELQFSGYYENQFFPQRINDSIFLQDYNKLRLDLDSDVAENLNFSADFIYQIYHGKRDFNALDFIPDKFDEYFIPAMQATIKQLEPLFKIDQRDRNFLDNAYATLYLDQLTLRIGKQQIPWGTGYAWNPTDVFNEKNLLDPTYEKEGVNAFKADISFSEEGSISFIWGIKDTYKKSTKAVKIKNHFAGFDVSAALVELTEESFGYGLFVPREEHRRMWGLDFAGQLLGLGLWGEAAFNRMAHGSDYSQILAGSDYTF